MIRIRLFVPVRSLALGLMLVAAPALAEDRSEGVVRITKPSGQKTAAITVRGQSEAIQPAQCQVDPQTGMAMGCPTGDAGGYVWTDASMGYGKLGRGHFGRGHFGECDDCLHGHCDSWRKPHHIYGWDHNGHDMLNYFKCKFGFLIPTGNGGAGTPPLGKYARVYPQDPYYFDQRDGQLYGAQGYGTAISVPLAPVVSHQYNYSWGTPASRLTPISRIAP